MKKNNFFVVFGSSMFISLIITLLIFYILVKSITDANCIYSEKKMCSIYKIFSKTLILKYYASPISKLINIKKIIDRSVGKMKFFYKFLSLQFTIKTNRKTNIYSLRDKKKNNNKVIKYELNYNLNFTNKYFLGKSSPFLNTIIIPRYYNKNDKLFFFLNLKTRDKKNKIKFIIKKLDDFYEPININEMSNDFIVNEKNIIYVENESIFLNRINIKQSSDYDIIITIPNDKLMKNVQDIRIELHEELQIYENSDLKKCLNDKCIININDEIKYILIENLDFHKNLILLQIFFLMENVYERLSLIFLVIYFINIIIIYYVKKLLKFLKKKKQ